MPLYALVILIVLPIVCSTLYPTVAPIDMYNFVPEFVMTLTVLACMQYLWRVKGKEKPNQILFIGFSLLFTALYIDCLDEVFELPLSVTLIVEDIFQVIGFIFIVIGIRMWLKIQNIQKQSLIKLATTDVLTGCITRRYFVEQLQNQLCENNPRLCILLFDIDHFKKINDQYGHNVGDTALIQFAALIQEQSRQSDLFARWGGEEFILLLPHVALSTALEKAETLRLAVENMLIDYCEGQFKMTVSIGVAEYEQSIGKLENLVEIADQHLYQAKAQGRNRVVG